MTIEQILVKIKEDSAREKGPVKADNYFSKEDWGNFYRDYKTRIKLLADYELFLIQAFIICTFTGYEEEYEVKYLFMYKKELINFWLMDAIDVLQEADTELIIGGQLSERLAYDFDRYYHLKELYDTTVYGCNYTDGAFGIFRHPGPRKDDDYLEYELDMVTAKYPDEYLNIFTEYSDIFYVVKSHKNEPIHKAVVGLKAWEKNLTRKYNLIEKHITKVLRNNNNEPLPFNWLAFKLNKLNGYLGVEKPINENILKEICNTFPKRFSIIEDSVRLSDDHQYIKEYFQTVRYSFDSPNYKKKFTGIFFIRFEGKEFPFKEAQEYVQTRPIIFIIYPDFFPISMEDIVKKRSSSENKQFSRSLYFIEGSYMSSNNKNSLSEFENYLHLFIGKEAKIEDWLINNCSFGVYEELADGIKYIYNKSLEIFSPVFNVENNPGNLFQYTLQEKIEVHGLDSSQEEE